MRSILEKVIFAVCTTVICSLLPAAAQQSNDAKLEDGNELYLQHCEYCHGTGVGRGATIILEERYAGTQPGALADRTNLEAESIRFYVRNWTPGMASFRPSEISESQLDSLIAWLMRNNP